MSDKLTVDDLTCGEWEAVKRRRSGLTQKEVAAIDGVDRLVVVRREKNKELHPQRCRIKVTEPEWCFMQRLRNGMTQKAVGESMGLSSFWVREMEAGRQSHERLMSFYVGNPM